MHEHIGRAHVVQKPTRQTQLAVLQAVPDQVDEGDFQVVVDLQVGVPGELHSIRPAHLLVGEQPAEVEPDDIVQKDDVVLIPRRRKRNEA